MNIDVDKAAAPILPANRPHSATHFETMLAQYAAPLFSPWAAGAPPLRNDLIAPSTALNTHPTASNRREGRHARG